MLLAGWFLKVHGISLLLTKIGNMLHYVHLPNAYLGTTSYLWLAPLKKRRSRKPHGLSLMYIIKLHTGLPTQIWPLNLHFMRLSWASLHFHLSLMCQFLLRSQAYIWDDNKVQDISHAWWYFTSTVQAVLKLTFRSSLLLQNGCAQSLQVLGTICTYFTVQCTYTASGVDQGAGKCFIFCRCNSDPRGCILCWEAQFTCNLCENLWKLPIKRICFQYSWRYWRLQTCLQR